AGSQIVFIASSKPEDVDRLLKAVADKPVLTIGETDGFTGSGGIIHFYRSQNRLRFAVNLEASRRSGIKLGSQILMSAEMVHKRQPVKGK
ncbi:MAG: YfiR family protein, partial [Deltaproteobacteria bacterium]|nr:YfiR family protein [Deltaproteobacteria bacterium]